MAIEGEGDVWWGRDTSTQVEWKKCGEKGVRQERESWGRPSMQSMNE